MDTSVSPPETKIWNGNAWVVQNDIETIRTTISILTEKNAQFQQTIDGLNSYVANLTETVETVSNDQGVLEERVLSSESRISQLQQTVDGLSVTMQEQYIGGINYVQNSSGLNGITDDWSYSGTVKTDASTDTQNNTISDSCFVLGAYSSLSQYIRGVVPGTYTISVRAKKTSTMSGYFYVTYNGNKTKYLFNKSTAFDWTDYSVTLTDVTDPTLRIYCYCRDASIYLADIMISEGAIPRKWTPAPNEIYTQEVKIDKRGIEVSNSASSQRTVIKLCVDICKRNGKTKLLWLGDKTKTLNYTPKSNKMVLTVHRWFANKSCPGNWMYARMGDLASKVTAALGSEVKPAELAKATTSPIKAGDLVKITGTKYYGGQTIPSWVKRKNWFVHSVSGDRAVINKSEDGKNAIMSPAKVSDLALVTSKPAETYRIYTVVHGDTLWAIAKKYLGNGSRYKEIVSLNELKSNVIYSGMKLKIPNK